MKPQGITGITGWKLCGPVPRELHSCHTEGPGGHNYQWPVWGSWIMCISMPEHWILLFSILNRTLSPVSFTSIHPCAPDKSA
jgi:hypothetical protein